ncbi:hypothetical protein MHU86_248 [Fragilaria crotonensis]|nr:hypothetical protein MHU86_248 [Fragilaria crotonensis]
MTNTGIMIPRGGVEAEILKYLTFEDLNHDDVFKGNLMIPEKSMYQFMAETNFEEPIRRIFRDVDNAAGVHGDDRLRLENLKALMKNTNFGHYMEKNKAIMELVFSMPQPFVRRLEGADYSCDFLKWLENQPESPEKAFILANQNDVASLLIRGRHTLRSKRDYKYHSKLPPAIADTVHKLIKRGDQDAAALLDQLLSNKIISEWFFYDCDRGGFLQSIVEMTRSGQSKVFFKDSIFGYWKRKHLQELATYSVKNVRVDILNEGLKKLRGIELQRFYQSIVLEIANLASDPGYDATLAKDLITENLQRVNQFSVTMSHVSTFPRCFAWNCNLV